MKYELNFGQLHLGILLFSNLINNINDIGIVSTLTSQSWFNFANALFLNEVINRITFPSIELRGCMY